MTEIAEPGRTRLETKAIVLGYAMSRLDTAFLIATGDKSWNEAYRRASAILGQPAATFKNLRDEFDPINPNPRRGWHRRPLRLSRLKVMQELAEVSDEAVSELALRILLQDDESTTEAIDALVPAKGIAAGVAERLLTGRRAEEFVLDNCESLLGFSRSELADMRLSGQGYDFAVNTRPELAVEVKGLRPYHGEIMFTDREWIEARTRRSNYWLAVVRNLQTAPTAEVIVNPYEVVEARCSYQRTLTAQWRARV